MLRDELREVRVYLLGTAIAACLCRLATWSSHYFKVEEFLRCNGLLRWLNFWS